MNEIIKNIEAAQLKETVPEFQRRRYRQGIQQDQRG